MTNIRLKGKHSTVADSGSIVLIISEPTDALGWQYFHVFTSRFHCNDPFIKYIQVFLQFPSTSQITEETLESQTRKTYGEKK